MEDIKAAQANSSTNQVLASDQHVTSEPPTLKKINSWLVPSLLVVILILLGSTGFFAYHYFQPNVTTESAYNNLPNSTESPTTTSQPTSDTSNPTISGWITYTNEQYGFEFDYPPQYSVKASSKPWFDITSNKVNPNDPNDFQSIFFEYREDLNYQESIQIRKSNLKKPIVSQSHNGVFLKGEGTKESQGEYFNVAIFNLNDHPASFTTTFQDPELIDNFEIIVASFKITNSSIQEAEK